MFYNKVRNCIWIVDNASWRCAHTNCNNPHSHISHGHTHMCTCTGSRLQCPWCEQTVPAMVVQWQIWREPASSFILSGLKRQTANHHLYLIRTTTRDLPTSMVNRTRLSRTVPRLFLCMNDLFFIHYATIKVLNMSECCYVVMNA